MKVEIDRIVHGGYGIARVAGRSILIPFTVPGDVLDVECSEKHGSPFGWIREIIRPSVHRRVSNCPVFTLCGGCDFDHMEYQQEIEAKKGILVEDLTRIGGIDLSCEIDTLFAKEYGYRNHAQFKVDSRGEVGFFEKKSHTVIPLPKKGCLLLQEEINEYVNRVRSQISFPKGGFRVRSDSSGIIYTKGIPGIKNDEFFHYEISSLKLRTNIDDFFQVNNFLLEKWLGRIAQYLRPERRDVVIDLFCGSGIISLSLARVVRAVTGIELNRNAVMNARFNAIENGLDNAHFIHTRAQTGIKGLPEGCKIVVDPPRAGLGPGLISGIVRLHPKMIVYVSCDTATFSRDLGVFIENGYGLGGITLVDMFPRTRHIELVALFLSP
jgi:23S rRNA (uracil1939-C5)-methyltransferase